MRQDRSKYITSPRASEAPQPLKLKEEKGFVTVVLLSENHGHRMKSYGPVSLLKVGGKSLLDKQIEAVRTILPNSEIVLCCGFEAYRTVTFVKGRFTPDAKIRVVENQLHYNTNSCESARLCLNNIVNDKILFCDGGVLLKPEHLAVINFKKSCVVIQDKNSNTNLEVGAIENNSILENLSFGIKGKYWSELFYLAGQVNIAEFYTLISNTDYKNKFLFEAINDYSKRFPVATVKIEENLITKIDNIKTIKGINK